MGRKRGALCGLRASAVRFETRRTRKYIECSLPGHPEIRAYYTIRSKSSQMTHIARYERQHRSYALSWFALKLHKQQGEDHEMVDALESAASSTFAASASGFITQRWPMCTGRMPRKGLMVGLISPLKKSGQKEHLSELCAPEPFATLRVNSLRRESGRENSTPVIRYGL